MSVQASCLLPPMQQSPALRGILPSVPAPPRVQPPRCKSTPCLQPELRKCCKASRLGDERPSATAACGGTSGGSTEERSCTAFPKSLWQCLKAAKMLSQVFICWLCDFKWDLNGSVYSGRKSQTITDHHPFTSTTLDGRPRLVLPADFQLGFPGYINQLESC